MTNNPVLISVAPNGARKTKLDHPGLPMSFLELAQEARRCVDSGARLYHLHVRDSEGKHSLSADLYREATAAIKAEVADSIIVQITTEACGVYDIATQMHTVRQVHPQAASFALREFVPSQDHEQSAASFFEWTYDNGILAQYILYSPAEALSLRALVKRGVIPQARPSVLFVLGRYADGISSDPRGLLEFLPAWDDSGPWSVCAFGASEISAAAAAIALGGHVRVGFENNLQRIDGALLDTNSEQVGRVARLAATMGRPTIGVGAAQALFSGKSCVSAA